MSTTSWRSYASLVLLIASGCASFDRQPWSLDRPRVLAIRVAAIDEPGRAAPRPAERVSVEVLVADPLSDRTADRAWSFEACVAAPDTRNGTTCDGAPFARLSGEGAVQMELELPEGEARILLSGEVCTASAQRPADAPPTCESAEERERTSIVIETSLDASNRHPVIAQPPTRDGAPLEPDAGCTDPQALRLPASRGATLLAWDLGPLARELLEAGPEEILVSHVTSAGELDRYRSIVEREEAPVIEVEYRPPPLAAIPAEGLDVRFVLVARDERGGVAWARGTLCVTAE